jgi:hypothetical protein
VANKATMGPLPPRTRRTYRAEVAVTRGVAVIQGTADDQAKLPAGGNVWALGIVEEDQATAGGPVSVVTDGECIGIAAAAINAGDKVEIAANTGKLQATTTDKHNVVGIARSSAAGDGDEFVIDVKPQTLSI